MMEMQKWGKDKPYIIRVFAAHLVSTVQDMHEDFQALKLRRFASHKFPLPDLPSWFAMYRAPRRTIEQTKAIWSAVYGKNFVNFFAGMLKKIAKQKSVEKNVSIDIHQSPDEMKEAWELLQMVLDISEKSLEEEFSNVPTSAAIRRRMNKLVAETPLESSFYVFVAVPCWALYRMSPTRLYRKAQYGDFDSLEKLLRLDQFLLHDPVIGKQIIQLRAGHSSGKYRKLIEASLKPPRGVNSRRNILLSQVGFISALSHVTQKPLTPQDLFELIEAFDKDSKCNLNDDLPDEPEALARALQPDRNLWRHVLSTDKKK
ncbi:MAG: hypothetical protein P4L44_15250 [Oryzomonas sp.]|uniref:hypothetical protein n=1 Tax=Oryzomonas sp. TaxID=2855186 RepID=UPI00284B3EF8|nr:hypothetical protein [Oryzomonas sp.]MDR3581317.1 hypothetical protein [Oryzomonas sp.]